MLCCNIKSPTLIIKVESSPTLVTPGEGFLKKVFSVDWKPGLPDKLVVNVDAQRLQVAFHLRRIIRKGETEFQTTYTLSPHYKGHNNSAYLVLTLIFAQILTSFDP